MSYDLGPMPKFAMIDKTLLYVDHRYQRELNAHNWKHIRKIAANFKWSLCVPLVVTYLPKDGKEYAVIDGQHRTEAALLHPSIVDVPCWLIPEASLAQQALTFEALNGARIGISAIQRFWAAHAAGEPRAVRVFNLCTQADVKISRYLGTLPARTTYSTRCIMKMSYPDETIVKGLRALADGLGKRGGLQENMIMATCSVVNGVARGHDPKVLASVIANIDMDAEKANANFERIKSGSSLTLELTRRLVKRYQNRLEFERSKR